MTVKRVAYGDWYMPVSVEIPLKPSLSDNGKQTGVDVGLKKHAATSDGSYRGHPKFFRQSEAKLKKQQRSLAKKEKGYDRMELNGVYRMATCIQPVLRDILYHNN